LSLFFFAFLCLIVWGRHISRIRSFLKNFHDFADVVILFWLLLFLLFFVGFPLEVEMVMDLTNLILNVFIIYFIIWWRCCIIWYKVVNFINYANSVPTLTFLQLPLGIHLSLRQLKQLSITFSLLMIRIQRKIGFILGFRTLSIITKWLMVLLRCWILIVVAILLFYHLLIFISSR